MKMLSSVPLTTILVVPDSETKRTNLVLSFLLTAETSKPFASSNDI
ncbi:hypothetical protein OKW24_001624 [Peribacillus simplex]|nr:hypothetical protein [Peribacillus simplex]